MEEIDVEVLRAAGVELRLELALRVLKARRAVSARHLVDDADLLAVVLLQDLSGVVLRLAADVHPRRVEVVDAVPERIVNQLVGKLLVDYVAALLRKAHHAEAEARYLAAVEVDRRDLERIGVRRIGG